MGKIIVVKNADFSAVALDKVDIIAGWRDINFTSYANTGKYLTMTQGWQNLGDGKLIPVNGASMVRFTANSQNKGQIVFSTATDMSGSGISVITLEVGETSADVEIPSNAAAIFLGTEFSGQDRTPTSFKLFYP